MQPCRRELVECWSHSRLHAVTGHTWLAWHACSGPAHTVFEAKRTTRIAGLVVTVEGLRAGLRSRGSDLVVLRGPLEERLPELAAAFGAARIVTEDEVEFRCDSCLHASIATARLRLLEMSIRGGPDQIGTGAAPS